MPALHIRDLDDALIDELKSRAKAHHRSLNSEVKTILAEAIARGAGSDTPAAVRPLKLHLVQVGASTSTSRDDIYDDDE
jgi:plasmid stability protein